MFPDLYLRAAMEILSLRRDGQRLLMRFGTKPSAARFEDELAAYELEVDPVVGSAGPWARGLPVTLFWALGFLCRSLPIRSQPDDECLMQASFAAARRLLKNHCDQVIRITRAALVEDRWKVARRIVEQLPIAETPGSFQDIARYFMVQKKERIAPVTNALIELGVLVINEDGIHQLGPVDLADVEEILNQRFALP